MMARMETSRRRFLLGLSAVLAAPAIVKAEVLMPVSKIIVPKRELILAPIYKHETSFNIPAVNWDRWVQRYAQVSDASDLLKWQEERRALRRGLTVGEFRGDPVPLPVAPWLRNEVRTS